MFVDEKVSLVLTVTNNGPGVATDVVLTVVLPPDLTWTLLTVGPSSFASLAVTESASGSPCKIIADVLQCNVGTLGAGGSFSVKVSAVTDLGNCGILTATMTVEVDGIVVAVQVTTFEVSCPATPTPTPGTPPPTPIGGIGIFPDLPGGDSAGGSAGALAAVIAALAAGVATAVGAVWHNRRRRLVTETARRR